MRTYYILFLVYLETFHNAQLVSTRFPTNAHFAYLNIQDIRKNWKQVIMQRSHVYNGQWKSEKFPRKVSLLFCYIIVRDTDRKKWHDPTGMWNASENWTKLSRVKDPDRRGLVDRGKKNVFQSIASPLAGSDETYFTIKSSEELIKHLLPLS